MTDQHHDRARLRGESSTSQWTRRIPLAFILASGISLSLILFFIVREAESKRDQADFERRAAVPVTAIQGAIDEHLELLRSIGAFYYSSHRVDRNEFRAFTEDALGRSQAIRALMWAPRIPAEVKIEHENAVRNEGYTDYQIAALDSTGARNPAPDRPVHCPVLYVAPEKINAAMVGIDLFADATLRQAMITSLILGEPASTPLTVVQGVGKTERVYRVVMPIFQNGADHETLPDRQRHLGGYAVLVVRPAVLIDTALVRISDAHTRALCLQAIDVSTSREAVYVSPNWREAKGQLEARPSVNLAGRNLQIICQPAERFFAGRTWQSFAVLISSIVLTLLVAGYLSSMWDRAAKVERQVEERTAELARSNSSLTDEIAAKKTIADALAHERYLVDALLDTTPDHIYYKDDQSRFIRINKTMSKLFKLSSPEEAVGKSDFDFFTAEHAQRAFEDEREIMRTGQPMVGREERETWPDGSVTWVSTTKEALRDRSGKIIGTFGISRDITARKRAEEALEDQARELKRSNTELEQFAYVASHDLQEPLRMVASYTQLLGRRYRGKLDHEADEFISYAVEGATRMQVLINDLLAYSRVGTRGKPFALTNCNEVLARTLANLKIAIEESGGKVTHDNLPQIMADGTQLTQLFQNLIGNALKFRSPEGRPEIHISAVLRASNSGRSGFEWLFAVRDNGIGVEARYYERIFIIFQRLHTREQYPGTGIGLAVCKKIVERHGGAIWVESTPGKGSTFYFTAPKVDLSTA